MHGFNHQVNVFFRQVVTSFQRTECKHILCTTSPRLERSMLSFGFLQLPGAADVEETMRCYRQAQ